MSERPKLTDAEFEIMEIVWELGRATVADVNQLISERRGKELSRTTIQVQMRRLESKGWLKHQKEQRNFYYSATVDRSTSTQEIISDVSDRVFSGSVTDLIKCLFESKKIDSDEIEELRNYIDDGEWSK